jgi:hypothetical protein
LLPGRCRVADFKPTGGRWRAERIETRKINKEKVKSKKEELAMSN